MVNYGVITSGIRVVSIGISVYYQWFPVFYHWKFKSAVTFGGSISGLPVFASGISVVLPVFFSSIPLEISGNIWYYQWYTRGF